ncbi:MAG: hypothetical protein WBO17_14650, partial [Sphingorhabdus sp.]
MFRPVYISNSLIAAALSCSVAVPSIAHAAGSADDAEDRRTIIVTGERQDDANPNANSNAPYKV